MKQIDIDNLEKETIKGILLDSKIQASENLKNRIMQQIATETVLSKGKVKNSSTLIKNICFIFGTMYALIVTALIALFYTYGSFFPQKSHIPLILICITSIFSFLALIFAIDEKRRNA